MSDDSPEDDPEILAMLELLIRRNRLRGEDLPEAAKKLAAELSGMPRGRARSVAEDLKRFDLALPELLEIVQGKKPKN